MKLDIDTTKLENVQSVMSSILAQRESELATIIAECEKIDAEIAKQTAAIDDAAASMDMGAYTTAKKNLASAEISAEMYRKRLDTIREKEMISESDSDAYIDSVIAFETEATALYEEQAMQLMRELHDITHQYKEHVKSAEDTMRRWCAKVHKNYRQNAAEPRGKTLRRDRPIAIRAVNYAGCDMSNKVMIFLEKFIK